MKAVVWVVAAIAVAIAYTQYNWKGVALVVTVVVFWQLLRLHGALGVMRRAAQRPVGHVGSAVMLNAHLKRGMTLLQIVALTGSLGRQVSESPERWSWVDAGGAAVALTLEAGKLVHWELTRPAE